jgi:hypothetical protein
MLIDDCSRFFYSANCGIPREICLNCPNGCLLDVFRCWKIGSPAPKSTIHLVPKLNGFSETIMVPETEMRDMRAAIL